MRRVVITGLGVISPIGQNVTEFGRNLFAGTVAVRPVSFARNQGDFTFLGCPIADYKPEDHFDLKRLNFYDRFAQFAVVAALPRPQPSPPRSPPLLAQARAAR